MYLASLSPSARQNSGIITTTMFRQCEESQAKIDQLEDSLNKSSFPVLDDEIPTTIPTLEESDKLIEKAELDHVERAEADDIDELTLKEKLSKLSLLS